MERPSRVAYHPRIRDLPPAERPRERLRDFGPASLSNTELLAILLRTGTATESALSLASRLLSRMGGLAGLARSSFRELCALKGLGEAKAAQVLAGLELGRRLLSLAPQERPVVRTPLDVANLLQAEMAFLPQEELRAVLLNTRNQVVGVETVYRGSVNTAPVRPAEVFRTAVRENCPAIILAHNHPSGDPTPSPDDIAITRRLEEAGRLLDIDLLDHIVLAQGGFVSLRERGLF